MGLFKKVILFVFILGLIAAPILWYKRQAVIQVIRGYPAIYSIASSVYQKIKARRFQNSSLGNLNRNESMKEADFVVEVGTEIGRLRNFWGGLGQDSFNEGMLKPVNRTYYEMIGELNRHRQVFNAVHGKGIFCDKFHVEDICGHVLKQDVNGDISYNWDIVDRVFDMQLAQGLKPLVSLTYMPESFASIPNRRNPWNKANISPPNDYIKWRDLVTSTIDHLAERYGENQVSEWYFEVWNEPDLPNFFWIDHPNKASYAFRGDNLTYFKFYDYTVSGAGLASTKIRIGGPALAGDIQLFINQWLPHIRSGKNYATGFEGGRVDFLSRHCYGNVELKILPGIKLFIDNAKSHGGDIVENGDFLITEFGPVAEPKQWLNTQYVAAWLVKVVDGVLFLGDEEGQEYVPDQMFFWTLPIPANFDKHFGIATALGHRRNPSPRAILKRPVFNAFDALSRLGQRRVRVTGTEFGDPIRAIATTSSDGSVQILIYHLNENDYANDEVFEYPVSLRLTDLVPGEYTAETFVIDATRSNSYKAWVLMDEPEHPTPQQLTLLQSKDDLELVSSSGLFVDSSRTFETDLLILNNSVTLMVMSRVNL